MQRSIGSDQSIGAQVAEIVRRARAAQKVYERSTQEQVDEVVTGCGWAIMHPARNRLLAELAVRDTGLGKVEDKVVKNHRKTLGLLRDLKGVKTVGVIAELPDLGLIEIARPVGVVAAITPSTNPAATPANQIINALKGRNAIILAPSPKGHTTGTQVVKFVHAELAKIGAPLDLVQILPPPISKAMTQELMRQVDLVVATGSQPNIRAAYSSGTPAFGVGAGNVAVIVDGTASVADAAKKIAYSKTFDYATSCSSENSLVIVDSVYDAMIAELERVGGVLLTATEKSRLAKVMWPDGKLAAVATAKSASKIAEIAGLEREVIQSSEFLMVEERSFGKDFPFSGEKLSPVLTLYRADGFEHARAIVASIYEYQGAGHSVGIHTMDDDHVMQLGLELPVCRVIVNQAHCVANGGNFDNGLPFSLSMGCGTWGRNNFSENMSYKHFLNITRIARTIEARVPTEEEIFSSYFDKYSR